MLGHRKEVQCGQIYGPSGRVGPQNILTLISAVWEVELDPKQFNRTILSAPLGAYVPLEQLQKCVRQSGSN